MRLKKSQMLILIKPSPGLEIIARWGPHPISMALRFERSLKSERLSLARTSKLVNKNSVLSSNNSEEGGRVVRPLIFSALNRSSSHRCGFEPSSDHM